MIGSVLYGRYQLLKLLGQGGFAITYLAADSRQNNRRCVVKHLTLNQRSPRSLAIARRLFQAEASVLKRLGTHGQIPELIDAFEISGEFYLVQGFIDGVPLSHFPRAYQPLTEREAIALLEDALAILSFVHGQGIIHRDIKPSNLMRRREDGRLVLIDFGAVKEITTQATAADGEPWTVSIGTQGYAPPEQLAGRPRYSSDLYALGMTIVQGLTGKSPTELPEHPQTGAPVWQESTAVSPGMTVFLQRLTHPSVYQRYQSAQSALQDLRQLDTLATQLGRTYLETVLPGYRPLRWVGVFATSLITTAVVLTIRQLGGWMPLELLLYDRWVQQQPDLGPDERLLLVEITQADLTTLDRVTPSDATLSRAIEVLQDYRPRVIGLDLFRAVPQGEGHEQLLETLKADNTVAIFSFGKTPTEAHPAPSTVPSERAGFSDIVIDPDGVVRRNLMSVYANSTPDSEILYSFSLRLALIYLEKEGIFPLQSVVDPTYLDLNNQVFRPLRQNFGAYRRIEDNGYQVMLQYRSPHNAAERLSLGNILEGEFLPEMIRDRIVIIGTTAPSAKDLFDTPFSRTAQEEFWMPGAMLHAQATSQILSHALDRPSLPWAFPEALEVGWIVMAAMVGGTIGGFCRRSSQLGLGLIGGEAILWSLPMAVFAIGGWLPLLPASISFGSSLIGAALYQSHRFLPFDPTVR